MEKSYLGKTPPQEDGWRLEFSFEFEKQEWNLFKKPQAHTDDWITYKLVVNGRAKRKANYWIVKNHKTGAVGFANDFICLQQHRPELYKSVQYFLDSVNKVN